MKNLIRMFFIFIKIGTFTLGGGYAMIPLMQEEMVEKNKWISEEEFLDIIAVAQSIPGALAINTSTYIGYNLFGFLGAVLGCLGTILPAIIIMSTISIYFMKFENSELMNTLFKGIRPAVVALILSGVIKLSKSLPKKSIFILWSLGTVICVVLLKIHPIWIIIGSALMGYMKFKGEIDYDTKDN
ncbi:MAG: chromate transporter [Anaeromicrobium sp.]|jgi:chromate transporter|uniref:chromate transporter n=1 Tax=Anaeromicrobium sp. TaxID=1929132 RepID=UPI0025E9D9CF|nr:chromate transporter [Anaeromicrobium sp.]MCT4595508.1 chromate transporter [Anaeromicrobium sp.]